MKVLVTGGAGYIGSHTVVQLLQAGHRVSIIDDLSNSSPVAIERVAELTGQRPNLHVFDLCDRDRTAAVVAQEEVEAAIHFAGFKAVGDSVSHPVEYYRNNIDSTLSLVDALRAVGARTLVFSSSATVYGASATPPLTEALPTSATNPYGWTKVMIEQMLRDVAVAEPGWRIALLRYFNPVGAHPSGLIGEDPSGVPNNLLPYLAQVAVGRRPELSVFGDDYPTPDGTGVRDYIHVDDVAAGHLAALDALNSRREGAEVEGSELEGSELEGSEPVGTWNLGTGRGTSVLELLRAFEQACGRPLPYRVVGRRPGDVAESFADPSKAERELHWRASRSLAEICTSEWRWRSTHPDGYALSHHDPAATGTIRT